MLCSSNQVLSCTSFLKLDLCVSTCLIVWHVFVSPGSSQAVVAEEGDDEDDEEDRHDADDDDEDNVGVAAVDVARVKSLLVGPRSGW